MMNIRKMSSRGVAIRAVSLLTFILCLAPALTHAAIQHDAATFVRQSVDAHGWTRVALPQDGRYVYTTSAGFGLADGRDLSAKRYMIGQPPRDRYVLFSAEEEAALWNLRERRQHDAARQPSAGLALTAPATPPTLHPWHPRHSAQRKAALVWPRVVVEGPRTCVPRMAYRDARDWKRHLTCWSGETRRVE